MTSQVMSVETIECTTAGGAVVANIRRVGAALASFVVDGREVVRPDSDAMRVNFSSGVTLAPWPNRLAGGHWTLEGRAYQGTLNEPLGNALHGLVYGRAFDVVERQADAIHLTCMLGDDAVYPFQLRVDVTYTVSDRGLSCSYEVTNLDAIRLPVALGAHPFFPIDDSCVLTLRAASLFENDEHLIPTGRLLPSSVRGVVADGVTPLAGFVADDCFTDLVRGADGLAVTSITYGDGFSTHVWQDRSFPYAQVFTKRDFLFATGVDAAIAIEPQSAPANALQTGVDLHWLQPTEQWLATWGIAVTSPDQSVPLGSH